MPVGGTALVARSITYPDTMKDLGSGTLVRLLPGGDTVRFASSGRHVASVNRLGHQTTFSYADGKLSEVEVASIGV